MTKKLRFHLQFNGITIRNLCDFKDNFILQDVYEVYTSKVLGRWLDALGETTYLEKLKKIKTVSQEAIIKELIDIFEVGHNKKDVDEAVSAIRFFEERKARLDEYKNLGQNLNNRLLKDYHQKYERLREECYKNPLNMKVLKTIAREIENNYYELFKLEKDTFIQNSIRTNPPFIFAMLCRESQKNSLRSLCLSSTDLANFYIEITEAQSDEEICRLLLLGENEPDETPSKKSSRTKKSCALGSPVQIASSGMKLMYALQGLDLEKLEKGIPATDATELEIEKVMGAVQKQYTFFAGETDEYWKDIEISKKVLVINIPEGTKVRSFEKRDEEITQDDLKESPFPILNGLVYKSNIEDKPLIYLEVE